MCSQFITSSGNVLQRVAGPVGAVIKTGGLPMRDEEFALALRNTDRPTALTFEELCRGGTPDSVAVC